MVVEAAAGGGALASAVLGAEPVCSSALRYVGVERATAGRAAFSERLPVEVPAFVLGPGAPRAKGDDEPAEPIAGRGPLVTVLAELPAQPFLGMVIANELLDNLPFDLLEWGDGTWREVRVGEERGAPAEILVPAADALVGEAERLVPAPVDGSRVPLQHGATQWLAAALPLVRRGRVICFDYATPTTADLAARRQHEWLRTYRGQGRGGSPLDAPGSQDVTCEVAVDQLARVRAPDLDRSQADWLPVHGVGDLVAAARATWRAAAARPDLTALVARSRLAEAAALAEPSGLGAFRVLEWDCD